MKKAMTDEERYRLKEIRLASKRGRGLSPEDMRFCELMLKKDPRGYASLNDEITAEVAEDFRFQ